MDKKKALLDNVSKKRNDILQPFGTT